MKKVIGVSFADSKKIYYFLPNKLELNKDDSVIVTTEIGEQFAKVVTDIIDVDEKKLKMELKNIDRKATQKDIAANNKNKKDSLKALDDAIKIASELELDMQLLNASFTFDRKQLLITFLADSRIDFRDLVKKLAAIYKTRIELRQIGVRDKAKAVGGYGLCGRELCCSTFLRDLNSVSINMAKNQNLALNPQKINGVCGRLMCCLSYENDNYSVYKKGLPKVGDKVVSNGETGKIITVDVFNRVCKMETADSKVITIEYKK
jgi:cell fate regulator YaaT (PSP1 superfamily)